MKSNSTFAKNVFTILGGTAIALAIPLMASPLISRIYSPETFGYLAIYISVISIGAIAATGRYELAIHIPQRETIALTTTKIAILLATLFSLGSFTLLSLFKEYIPQSNEKGVTAIVWVYTVPIGILILSVIQTITNWQARKQKYKVVASARAMQALTTTGIQIGTGVIGLGPTGLITAQIIGMLSSALTLSKAEWTKKKLSRLGIHKKRLAAIALKYSNMPRFMILGHLANTTSSQLPVIMLATLYGPKEAGIYAFAERLIILPCSLVTNSIGEVFRQTAAREYNSKGNCLQLYINTKIKLILIGLTFSVLIMTLTTPIFSMIFSNEWNGISELTTSIAIIVLFQSISSPLSQTILLASMYKLDLIWQIVRLSLSAAGIYFGLTYYNDFRFSIFFHAIAFSLAYCTHSLMQYSAAKGK